MKLRIGYELIYDCPKPTPMILTLNVHFSRVSDLVALTTTSSRFSITLVSARVIAGHREIVQSTPQSKRFMTPQPNGSQKMNGVQHESPWDLCYAALRFSG